MAVEIDTSAFTEEAYELLSELEDSLLELEQSPQDKDLISRVFRAMHTIKGSGAMFGFDAVAAFTHDVETVFDMARNGHIPVTKLLIDLTLAARDQIRALLDAAGGKGEADETEGARIIQGLRALMPGSGGAPAPTAAAAKTAASIEEEHTFRVRLKPSPEIFFSGTNPLLLLREMKDLGAMRVVAMTRSLPALADLNPDLCHTHWEIFLTTQESENAIRDIFIFVEDQCDLNIKRIDPDEEMTTEPEKKRLGEILVERGDIKKEDLDRMLHPIGTRLVEAGLVGKEQVQAALVEQSIVQDKKEKQAAASAADATNSVRVPSQRLDTLVNLVGELVTVQARLNQTAASLNDHDLQLISEEIERLTGELRDNTMSIRMLAIGTTFNKFRRLVRDLSKELGKEIELTTDGAETELDKTVIDQLNDPLVHIIRNSIDHGVETPDAREAAGKPRGGTIHLSAQHSGANVLIRVADDGKGMDPGKLRGKAIEKGLISPDQELTDKECFGLIFLPGFSTAATITNVSGRGVGMDVVRKSIDALRGNIEVNSKLGAGTTITLKLPLTLAIIEGLLVKIGAEFFVLPLSAVEECVELSRQDIARTHGRHVINVRGEIIPYIRIRDRFQIDTEAPEIEQIVIVAVDDRRVGFVVDHVIGQHQTVIKTLGNSFRHSEELSGATILGDGTVALILDLQRMVRYVEDEESNRASAA